MTGIGSGVVYWVTGLSGAGKTTVGGELYRRLKLGSPETIFLDGDDLRAAIAEDLGHGAQDRLRCAMRYARLCRMLSAQGRDVVIATISMFHEVHSWNRRNIPHYREIFLKVPLSILRQRDPKGIYARQASGSDTNVVGLGVDAEEPLEPDLILGGDDGATPSEQVDQIFKQFGLENP